MCPSKAAFASWHDQRNLSHSWQVGVIITDLMACVWLVKSKGIVKLYPFGVDY